MAFEQVFRGYVCERRMTCGNGESLDRFKDALQVH